MNRRQDVRLGDLKKDMEEAFDESFSLVAFVMNRFLVDHFIRAGRMLVNNDYDALVIWATLAHQNVVHLMPPGSIPSEVLTETGELPDVEQRLNPLRLRDLAQITGIPRETVRRKLSDLEKLHLVMRVGPGWQVSVERLNPDLREFTRESVYRFMACSREIEAAFDQVRKKSDRSLGTPTR